LERTGCTNCGEVAATDSKYCARCGAALNANTPTGSGGPSTAGAAIADPMAAFLIYLLPVIGSLFALCVSPYKERDVLRFHAWQAIFMLVLWVGLNIALAILTIPFTLVGLPLGAGLIGLTNVAFFLAWIYLMLQSVTGKPARIPHVAELADEQVRKK